MATFSKLLIEKGVTKNTHGQKIVENFKKMFSVENIFEIENYEDIFQSFYKPYLEKRNNLNIFLAQKKGQLLKETPDAYGGGKIKRYYFIHAYNCIYECNYCYLQGFFKSPDIVLFINHEEILNEMEKIIKQYSPTKDNPIWFHAGEFSDSLALSHLTQELPLYFNFFKSHPHAYLELRTKSSNISELLKLAPLDNVVTSFSLSPKQQILANDFRTPTLAARLSAMNSLKQKGFPLGLHLDPVIYSPQLKEEYTQLCREITDHLPLCYFNYISIGVVRFTKEVYEKVKEHYPSASFLNQDLMTKSFDNKYRAIMPLRKHILNTVYQSCLENGAKKESIYFCMEEESTPSY